MDGETTTNAIDLASRLRRTRGRTSRTVVASTKVTRAEQSELEMAAGTEGKALSEWAREVLLREARSPKHDAVFTELVSMRMLLNNVLKVVATGQKMTVENFQEIQTGIRGDKRKVAADLMRQYTQPDEKGQ